MIKINNSFIASECNICGEEHWNIKVIYNIQLTVKSRSLLLYDNNQSRHELMTCR